MRIEYEDESGIDLGIDNEAVAGLVAQAALDYMHCPYEAQISILVTTDEEIHVINSEQRGIDRATDVLSFPMIVFENPGDFSFLQTDDVDCFDPDTQELLLGDIVISAEHVLAQAKEYGHSVRREFAFLVAHSMLHLIGYDHMTDEEAQEMERLQEEILTKLGITREV